MQVTHDMKLLIATGKSRMEKRWQNKELKWSELLDKLSEPTRTRETVAEYAVYSKTDRDNTKDIGGFVGGYLKDGRRGGTSAIRTPSIPRSFPLPSVRTATRRPYAS